MAELYRKSALERLSSPEQQDKTIVVVSPMSWIVLAALTVIVVITIVWSVVGTLPETVSTSGIVSSPVSTNAIYAPESGKVLSVNVHGGSAIGMNDVVMSYQTGKGDVCEVLSDQVGTVTNVTVKVGEDINQGSEIMRISPRTEGNQVIVCYVKLADAKKIERGMTVMVMLSAADKQTYGHMTGRVINIDSYVSSTKGMAYVLGADNNLAATFQKDGAAVVAVTCELYPDPGTVSGYYWSNEKGKTLDVTNGSLVEAKIVTKEIAPIAKLFTKLKEIWGD